MKKLESKKPIMISDDEIDIIIITKHGEYNIKDTDEYKRIVKSLNADGVKFIRIGNDLININIIEAIKNNKEEFIPWFKRKDKLEEK